MPVAKSEVVDTAKNLAHQAADKAGNWFESVKVKAEAWFASLDITAMKIVELFSYLGIGFFAGFLFKKYLRYVLLLVAVFAGLLWALHSFNLISVNWTNAQDMFGVVSSDSVGSLFDNYLLWVKQNLIIVFSAFVGFLLGYKVG